MSCVCVCVDLESSLWNAGATIASGFSRLRGAHASSSTLLTWLWSLGLTQTVLKWVKSCQIHYEIFLHLCNFFLGALNWFSVSESSYGKWQSWTLIFLGCLGCKLNRFPRSHSLECSFFGDFNEWNFLVKLHLRKVCKSFKIADMCACVQRNQRRRATNVRSTVFHRRSTNVTTYMSGGTYRKKSKKGSLYACCLCSLQDID